MGLMVKDGEEMFELRGLLIVCQDKETRDGGGGVI